MPSRLIGYAGHAVMPKGSPASFISCKNSKLNDLSWNKMPWLRLVGFPRGVPGAISYTIGAYKSPGLQDANKGDGRSQVVS